MNGMSIELESTHYGPQAKEDMLIAMQKACSTIANQVRDRAKSLVPVDSGALKNTIIARNVLKPSMRPMSVVSAGDREGKLGFLGQEVYYHYMVEYGTYYKDAHPFMRPAAKQNFNAFRAEARRQAKRAANAKRRATDKARRIKARLKG